MRATFESVAHHPHALVRIILIFCLATFVVETQAQEILMPQSQYSATPSAVQQYQTNRAQVFSPTGVYGQPQREEPPIQWGPVTLRPRMFYRFLYADALPSSQTSHVASIVHSLSPGFLFGLGTHWTLDYAPAYSMYSSSQFKSTFDQNVRLQGGTTFEDWTLGLLQSYSSSSEPLIETGTQTDQENFITDLSASYRFNSKMWTDLSFNQSFVSAESFSTYRQWSTLDWLNYQFGLRLDAAVGVSAGFVDADAGSDMTFEGLQMRTRWRATEKLSFEIYGGFEVREFLSGDAGTLVNPIVTGTIQYQPFEFTRLSLNFNRAVSSSFLPGQVTENTGVNARLNQRLLGVVYLDLAGGYSNTKYISSIAGSSSREDNNYFFNAGLNCTIRRRGTAGIFYRYTDNTSTSSTLAGVSLSSNQAGFELGYHF